MPIFLDGVHKLDDLLPRRYIRQSDLVPSVIISPGRVIVGALQCAAPLTRADRVKTIPAPHKCLGAYAWEHFMAHRNNDALGFIYDHRNAEGRIVSFDADCFLDPDGKFVTLGFLFNCGGMLPMAVQCADQVSCLSATIWSP